MINFAGSKSHQRNPDIRATASFFHEYFDVIPATNPELMEEVFRLRYDVYCSETNFENPADFPEQLERDYYDHRSAHSLLRHKRTGINAGTVRLVLPEPGRLQSLPLHTVTEHPFFLDETRFSASTVAEVSRFAISKSFRHRLDKFPWKGAVGQISQMSRQVNEQMERKVMAHIALGLFTAMVKTSSKMGITTWFCVMEKSLVRLLARYSLYFKPIGLPVEYRGKRQPCYADIENLLAGVKSEQPDIWRLITANGRHWPTEIVGSSTALPSHQCLRDEFVERPITAA